MRILADIPHPYFKISIFMMNQRYIIKFETGSMEQAFKIAESDIEGGLDEVKSLIQNEDFLEKIKTNFTNMGAQFNLLMNS